MSKSIPVALAKCPDYEPDKIQGRLFQVLEAAEIRISPDSRILLKPNLLMKLPLACTNSRIVATLAEWLLNQGAKVAIADSPAFGNAAAIARAIGLSGELKRLGLAVKPLSGRHLIHFQKDGKKLSLPVSPEIFEYDQIFSICRIKAHSQMRLSLSVKNCFGVIPGLHKAFAHARYGDSTEFFAACIASLFKQLPPVTGIADGIVAMHITGPSKGSPFPLKLLGASRDAQALDLAIMKVLNVPPSAIPLAVALEKMEKVPDKNIVYPLEKPEAFDSSGFILPESLKPVSFNPWRLARSCIKRIWTSLKA